MKVGNSRSAGSWLLSSASRPTGDKKKRATYQNVLDAPPHLVAEIIDGERLWRDIAPPPPPGLRASEAAAEYDYDYDEP